MSVEQLPGRDESTALIEIDERDLQLLRPVRSTVLGDAVRRALAERDCDASRDRYVRWNRIAQ